MAGSIAVLYVAGDRPTATATARSLTRADDRLAVERASSADDALDRLDGTVDCVVSTVDLPDSDGVAFLEAVRADHPSLPFVLFAADGNESVASDAIAADVSAYVPRDDPDEPVERLAERVVTAVREHRTARDADRYRHRLEQVLKTVPACVVQIDSDGRFTFANERAEEVLGLERDAVADRTYNDPAWEITDLDGDPIPDEELPFRQVRDSGEPVYGFRHTVTWPDGTQKALLVNGAPLFDADGAVVSTVFALTDITDHLDRERRIERQRDRLEHFAAILAHDLRNPLNVADGELEFARAERDDEHLATVAEMLDRSQELIGDLLALARGGEVVSDPEPVDLASLVEACWRSVDTADATLSVATDRTVRADRQSLKQLVENLLRNAVQHGGSGVTVEVDDLPDREGFYVADDGPGIVESERESVFETVYSTDEEGTGLGLAIVREIAHAHGWDVSVAESRAGGARVVFATDGAP